MILPAVLSSLLGGLLLLWACEVAATPPELAPFDVGTVVARMAAAFQQMDAYQAEIETSEYQAGRIVTTRRFRFSFRKPDLLRIDMETPHPGMRLVYPDETGRVFVQFGGWKGFLKLRLAPDNPLLATRSGQRIDQSDLGLLIRNIARSVGEPSRGEPQLVEKDRQLLLEVVAADHFLPGVVTRYRFVIDKTLWLPVAVDELTPDGRMKRTVRFRNLNISPQLPEDFFAIDGKTSSHGPAAP